jgi:hypothetical protein
MNSSMYGNGAAIPRARGVTRRRLDWVDPHRLVSHAPQPRHLIGDHGRVALLPTIADGLSAEIAWRTRYLDSASRWRLAAGVFHGIKTPKVGSAAVDIEIICLERPTSHTSHGDEARHQICFCGRSCRSARTIAPGESFTDTTHTGDSKHRASLLLAQHGGHVADDVGGQLTRRSAVVAGPHRFRRQVHQDDLTPRR